MAFRVPTADVSVVDLTCRLANAVSVIMVHVLVHVSLLLFKCMCTHTILSHVSCLNLYFCYLFDL